MDRRPSFERLISQSGKLYAKRTCVQARRPTEAEIGTMHTTWIMSVDDVQTKETSQVLTADKILVRQGAPLEFRNGQQVLMDGKPVYNEYLVPETVFVDLYGPVLDDLTTVYGPSFSKRTLTVAVPISDAVLEEICSCSPTPNTPLLKTDWGLELAEAGGLLVQRDPTSYYAVSRRDSATYQEVGPADRFNF